MIKFWFKNHVYFSYCWLIILIIAYYLDNKYQYLSTFQVLLVLGGVSVLNWFPIIFKKRIGCLSVKNEEQVSTFFEELYRFKERDLVFYNEQVSDLTEDEKYRFNDWILNNNKNC